MRDRMFSLPAWPGCKRAIKTVCPGAWLDSLLAQLTIVAGQPQTRPPSRAVLVPRNVTIVAVLIKIDNSRSFESLLMSKSIKRNRVFSWDNRRICTETGDRWHRCGGISIDN